MTTPVPAATKNTVDTKNTEATVAYKPEQKLAVPTDPNAQREFPRLTSTKIDNLSEPLKNITSEEIANLLAIAKSIGMTTCQGKDLSQIAFTMGKIKPDQFAVELSAHLRDKAQIQGIPNELIETVEKNIDPIAAIKQLDLLVKSQKLLEFAVIGGATAEEFNSVNEIKDAALRYAKACKLVTDIAKKELTPNSSHQEKFVQKYLPFYLLARESQGGNQINISDLSQNSPASLLALGIESREQLSNISSEQNIGRWADRMRHAAKAIDQNTDQATFDKYKIILVQLEEVIASDKMSPVERNRQVLDLYSEGKLLTDPLSGPGQEKLLPPIGG